MTGMRDEEERRMMQMLAAQQAANTPQARAAEERFMQQRQAITGRDKIRRDEQGEPFLYGGQGQKPEEAGLLSRLGRGALDALQDPVRNAQIVAALNSMRLQPDPNLVAGESGRRTKASSEFPRY